MATPNVVYSRASRNAVVMLAGCTVDLYSIVTWQDKFPPYYTICREHEVKRHPFLVAQKRLNCYWSPLVVHVLGLLNNSDEAIRITIRKEIHTIILARYRLSPDVKSRLDTELPNEILLDYLNGNMEQWKHGRYIDVSDPAAGFPTVRKHVQCTITLDESSSSFMTVMPDTLGSQSDNTDGAPSHPTGSLGPTSRLSKVGQVKRLCQHAAQLRWNEASHQGGLDKTHTIRQAITGFARTISILFRTTRSVRYNNRNAQVLINQAPPDIIANGLRPDIVVIREKEVIMVDVVVTSQPLADSWTYLGSATGL
ncbi:hypothetical protein INT44_002907 [Umbelopsis vinacea]|uniref:Uncharacterized protein n=1 Tax=Umbelopsis vinacea TaxID=44442 RepID=A0A8H7UNW9_9FUNG|nr:hypothetical protein INT44_002907 [Umbelopsis vinacea]